MLKKKEFLQLGYFGMFLTLSFTFIKRALVGNLNLASYGHFVFPCDVATFSPFEKGLFNFARKCGIFVARFQILFKQ